MVAGGYLIPAPLWFIQSESPPCHETTGGDISAAESGGV